MTSNKKKAAKGLGNPALLDKIDKLFKCNVGSHIDLPQLVVVGDQSSGKSSVLEGLTDLPFPRDSGLCTRFATKIEFRRDVEEHIEVSIIPSKGASDEHAEKVRAFAKTNLKDLDAGSFAEVMLEAQMAMGISGPGQTNDQMTTFTEDVLCLTIKGPNEEHLTIIDVPGIFRKTTEGLMTKTDVELVRRIVLGYMENPRSLMLTVIPANVDIATQEILDLAQDLDPSGTRTLGVLTKLDLVDRGAHQPVMDLLQGKRHKLVLGWHAVLNPNQEQLTTGAKDYNRHLEETNFFKTKVPWRDLDQGNVGIAALRTHLQVVLAAHIRREFPTVKSELSKKLVARKRELEQLGPSRETTAEQTNYLLDIAMEFEKIVNHAVLANYGGLAIFDDNPALRLATAVVSRNEEFSKMVNRCGHKYAFDRDRTGGPNAESGSESEYESEPVATDLESDGTGGSSPAVIATRSVSGYVDLDDIVPYAEDIESPIKGNIVTWLEQVYKDSRGFSLGTFDSHLLASTMRKQSVKWESLAHGYITDVAHLVHRFILELLQQICHSQRVRDSLLALIHEELLASYERAFAQITFVLCVEREGTPLTQNHYFNDNLEKCRQKRSEKGLEKHVIHTDKYGEVIRKHDLHTKNSMSNTDYVVQDIHDILYSYYKVARKRFVDVTCMQGADFHLISGPRTPLKIFSPKFVAKMSEEQLEEVAGEERILKLKRFSLKQEIQELEAGRRILN